MDFRDRAMTLIAIVCFSSFAAIMVGGAVTIWREILR